MKAFLTNGRVITFLGLSFVGLTIGFSIWIARFGDFALLLGLQLFHFGFVSVCIGHEAGRLFNFIRGV